MRRMKSDVQITYQRVPSTSKTMPSSFRPCGGPFFGAPRGANLHALEVVVDAILVQILRIKTVGRGACEWVSD